MRKLKIASFFDTKKIARLANLPLTKQEINKYTLQLVEILNYIEQLNRVDTLRLRSGQASGVNPTYNVTGLSNVMREDETKESLSQKEAIENTANTKDGFIVTKGVFEE